MRSRMLVWRTGVLLRRENRRRRRVLRRELASYTPTELVDLEAVIERYPVGQTRELRSMLGELQLRREWSRRWHAA